MANITITIPDAQVPRVLDAIAGLNPIPKDPITGNPLFTKGQWAREWLKRLIRKTVARYETQQAQITAVVPEDNAIVDVT